MFLTAAESDGMATLLRKATYSAIAIRCNLIYLNWSAPNVDTHGLMEPLPRAMKNREPHRMAPWAKLGDCPGEGMREGEPDWMARPIMPWRSSTGKDAGHLHQPAGSKVCSIARFSVMKWRRCLSGRELGAVTIPAPSML